MGPQLLTGCVCKMAASPVTAQVCWGTRPLSGETKTCLSGVGSTPRAQWLRSTAVLRWRVTFPEPRTWYPWRARHSGYSYVVCSNSIIRFSFAFVVSGRGWLSGSRCLKLVVGLSVCLIRSKLNRNNVTMSWCWESSSRLQMFLSVSDNWTADKQYPPAIEPWDGIAIPHRETGVSRRRWPIDIPQSTRLNNLSCVRGIDHASSFHLDPPVAAAGLLWGVGGVMQSDAVHWCSH